MRDGSRFYASGVLTPLGGGSAECVKIARDLTERERAENALRQSEQRLRDLNATLERRVEERTVELRELPWS